MRFGDNGDDLVKAFTDRQLQSGFLFCHKKMKRNMI